MPGTVYILHRPPTICRLGEKVGGHRQSPGEYVLSFFEISIFLLVYRKIYAYQNIVLLFHKWGRFNRNEFFSQTDISTLTKPNVSKQRAFDIPYIL